MAKKEQENFTVTDRRLFTAEGDLRKDVPEEPTPEAKREQKAGPQPVPPVPEQVSQNRPSMDQSSSAVQSGPASEQAIVPPLPSASEQKEQADAYRKSAKELDARVELSGHSAKELEMTFERFMASLYMTAMLQLGLMREENAQPHVDIIGARQTIDTLGLLSEKTRGNLSSAEENFLQNCLYELRMAYVEVTNALARPPQASGTTGGPIAR